MNDMVHLLWLTILFI